MIRTDYDLALLRLDYPIADPDTGLGVLVNATFNMATIMPICLPPNKQFKDTRRSAVAVGLGITAENPKEHRCFTDGNGPVVFQQCSESWVEPDRRELDDLGEYPHAEDRSQNRCSKEPPPSSKNELCNQFHEKILLLK